MGRATRALAKTGGGALASVPALLIHLKNLCGESPYLPLDIRMIAILMCRLGSPKE
jgi:hypothetical protein